MEPQIIHYYNHKNVLCKICGRKGHTSECCPNVGMAKIGDRHETKKEKKEDDFMVTIPSSTPPKKKRGRKPKKEEKTYKFTIEQEIIRNSSNRDSYLPEKGWSDTAWKETVQKSEPEPEGLPPIPERLFQ